MDTAHLFTETCDNGSTHAARIEDLGTGDFAKVDYAVCCRMLQRSSAELRCSLTALLSTAFLSGLGLNPRDKVLHIKNRLRCIFANFPLGFTTSLS